MPRTANWQCAVKEMKNLLIDLDHYVDIGDWRNVELIQHKLMFHIRFEPIYEEEKQKVLHIKEEKKKC